MKQHLRRMPCLLLIAIAATVATAQSDRDPLGGGVGQAALEEGASVDGEGARHAALETEPPAPTVIMISLDGTRPVDVGPKTMPSLDALAKLGARARGLTPPTPSNTFPSHVTLVTGVAPSKHGIVNNSFIDPDRGVFTRHRIPDWIDVEPLWSYLEGKGVVTASYHWVGSEGDWKSGRGPSYWRPFSSSVPAAKKVETILAWLDLPDRGERPHFITSWFHGSDHAAHVSGPSSKEVKEALMRQDPAIAALERGIEERGLWPSTTLLVVSDHGMAAAKKRVYLDRELADREVAARAIGVGGFASVYIDARKQDGRAAEIERVRSVARDLGLQATIRVGAKPSHQIDNPRFGDVVVRAPIGTAIYRDDMPTGGFHGYEATEKKMRGLFIAVGRGVTPGASLSVLRAIDVAPTVLRLLGQPVPGHMEGGFIEGINPPNEALGAREAETRSRESARILPTEDSGREPELSKLMATGKS